MRTERRRLEVLAERMARLEKRFCDKQRWQSSREVRALLAAHPVVMTMFLSRNRECTLRSAQRLLAELASCGAVRHKARSRGLDWWVADWVEPGGR